MAARSEEYIESHIVKRVYGHGSVYRVRIAVNGVRLAQTYSTLEEAQAAKQRAYIAGLIHPRYPRMGQLDVAIEQANINASLTEAQQEVDTALAQFNQTRQEALR